MVRAMEMRSQLQETLVTCTSSQLQSIMKCEEKTMSNVSVKVKYAG